MAFYSILKGTDLGTNMYYEFYKSLEKYDGKTPLNKSGSGSSTKKTANRRQLTTGYRALLNTLIFRDILTAPPAVFKPREQK